MPKKEMKKRHFVKRDSFNIVLITLIVGLTSLVLSEKIPDVMISSLFSNLGTGVIAAGFLSFALDAAWAKERAEIYANQVSPLLGKIEKATKAITDLEGRFIAFKELGLISCHHNREDALVNFYNYAEEALKQAQKSIDNNPESANDFGEENQNVIQIVSSSCRGLIGHIDRDPHNIQNKWRNLVKDAKNKKHFKILLTHPSYAHLRQPAEESPTGRIELEIIKTAIFLVEECKFNSNQLRLYRGSPTVFLIRINNKILINPYPYGQMAMNTLSLEFEGNEEKSLVRGFSGKHFNDTWAFCGQLNMKVEGEYLVTGVDGIDCIIDAFSKCTVLGDDKKLRLKKEQVEELDNFYNKIRKDPDKKSIFTDFCKKNDLKYFLEEA